MTEAEQRLKILGVIPARGGSKRFKRKNLQLLEDKPLVAYTIETALKTKLFDKILLSTDDQEIAGVGRSRGISVYNLPKKYTADTGTVLKALIHLMQTLGKQREIYDVVCQMLPTCLFRKVEDIKEGMKMLDHKTDSVVSISAYDFPLPKSLKKKGELIEPFWPNSPFLTGKTRTQDQEVFYHDNGAFYISWWSSMMKYRNFYLGKVKGYVIHPLNAFDIDVEIDLIQAQALIDWFKAHPKSSLKKWLSPLFRGE